MFPVGLAMLLLTAFPTAAPAGPVTAVPAATRPAQPASTAPASPEDRLWAEILALKGERPEPRPAENWFAAARRQREALLARLRLYQTLYPGGAHQVQAVRLELATLHEVGVLDGGEFDPLCQRATAYARQYAPDHPVAWEAAYWQMLCASLRRAAATTRPASAPILSCDEELLAAYRTYVAHYPRSPYVPRLVEVLFRQAQQADDLDGMERLVATLEAGFPNHAVTTALRGQYERRRAVGQLFWLAARQPDGSWLDTRTWLGVPVLIVVWSAAEPGSEAVLRAVDAFRREHAEVRVVGVNLDTCREPMESACRAWNLTWPQFNDGLGRANRFARRWGVTRTPCVFVVGRHGRLLGWAEDDTWRSLAEAAVTSN